MHFTLKKQQQKLTSGTYTGIYGRYMTERWSLKGAKSEEQRDAPLRTVGGMFFLKHVITTACPIVLAERQVKLL